MSSVPTTKIFPNWSMETTQQVVTIYLCVQGVILTALFIAMLIKSKNGLPSRLVTILSVLFIVGDLSLAIATIFFNHFQSFVLKRDWHAADLWAYPFNVFMFLFVVFTCLPHFFFF